jgi:murein DD-endopeptidase MepM/ murein hydrolase activator NlpD
MDRLTLKISILVFIAVLVVACDAPIPTGSETPSEGEASATSSASATESVSASSSESSAPPIALPDFPFDPPTQLTAGSGAGYSDTTNWAPGICFPLADTPSYANSQVYRPGGSAVPSNPSQCATQNYSYPWQDNFCESRSWANPVCNTGKGHQGQDIRPKTCKVDTYWAVAPEDGIVTQLGSMTVAITGKAAPHRIYRYLHMKKSSVRVALHQSVVRGQKLGLVSNNLGINSQGKQQFTTIHLHFEIRVGQTETLSDGTVLSADDFVPPYTALVDSYRRKLAGDCPTVE